MTGLWSHAEFMKLWLGQTISQFGSMITRDALPLTAVLVLQVTPVQMGLLAAVGAAPVLFIGLLAGAWVDRLRRRPILIAADLGRALLLGTIPVAALLGWLSIGQLYVVAALTGVLTVFFDVAYQSFLPTLVPREQIVEGNSKLGLSDSLAEIAGPPLGGSLVQLISAPLTILLDAISFLFSALFIGLIRTPEPAPAPPEPGQSIWRDIGAGLRVVSDQPLLRALTGSSGTRSFFGGFFGALYSLYVIRALNIEPAILGLLIGSGGVGALLGALLVRPVTRRFGLGATLIGSMLVTSGMAMLIPLAGGSKLMAVSLLLAAQVLGDLALAIYFISEVSLRQTITPDRLLGRVTASMNFTIGGLGTLGLLAGGLLGQLIGLRLTLTVAVLGNLLAGLWLFFSPVRRLGEQEVGSKE